LQPQLYNLHIDPPPASIMKLTNLSVLALSASLVNARFIERHEKDQVVLGVATADAERFLIELAPGKTRWVTEDEKWELRRVSRGCRELNTWLIVRVEWPKLHGHHRRA